MTWRVRLTGEESTLQSLKEVCESDELSISQDASSGMYYLESSAFTDCASENEVLNEADSLLDAIYGFGKIEDSSGTRPETAGVIKTKSDGTEHVSVSIKEKSTASDSVRVEATDSEGNREQYRTGDWAKEIARLTLQDEDVEDLANLLSKEDSWVNLYRIYEFIEDKAGNDGLNIVDEGWISKKDKNSFKRTANSREAIGDEARHANERASASDDPMKPNEAQRIIYSLVRSWVEYKKGSSEK